MVSGATQDWLLGTGQRPAAAGMLQQERAVSQSVLSLPSSPSEAKGTGLTDCGLEGIWRT